MTNLRITLVVALLFTGYLLFSAWQRDYAPEQPAQTPRASQQAGASGQENDVPSAAPERPEQAAQSTGDVPTDVAGEMPSAAETGAAQPEAPAQARPAGQRVSVETDVLRVVIGSSGGNIREAYLKDYPVEVDQPDNPVALMIDTPGKVFLAQSGLLGKGAKLPDHRAEFTPQRTSYALGDDDETLSVPLTWQADGVRVTKTYTFKRGSYQVELTERVENDSGKTISVRHYRQLQRTPKEKDGGFSLTNPNRYTYFGAAVYSPEDKYVKVPFDEMEENPLGRQITGGWAAMVQHYFFAAWIPQPGEADYYYSKVHKPGGGTPRYIVGAMTPQEDVAAGASREFSTRLYAGPMRQSKLEDVAPGLQLTVDYGIFTVLAQPLFWILSLVHGVIGNWGWAIVVVTLLIKLVFFKLTETQYKSMAKLRKVQPRMQALKERYGDDKQKLNQAMMELYKTEKVNPLGGCLPLLIQIPFLIAFYWVLLESVELRQAPWMLWIQDLSSPDPFYILPAIMGASMLLQQWLTPSPTTDPMQRRMMMVLPLVFTVMFAFFQSGLVLYWTTNNLLSLAQQWFITKRMEAQG